MAEAETRDEAGEPRLNIVTRGSGPHVVMIHGGMGTWKHWIRNIDVLAEHFTVHAIDQLGYGQSDDVPAETDKDGYLDYTEAALRAQLPMDVPISWVGFSFGSATCGAMAARFGARTRSLSVMGPAGLGSSARRVLDLWSYKKAAGDPAKYEETLRHNLLQLMLKHPESVSKEALDIQQDAVEHTRFDSRLVSWSTALLEGLRVIQCPVQVIWGEFDASAYPNIEGRSDVIRGARPDAHFFTVPNAGHWVSYEGHEEVNRLLIDFIRSTL